MAHWHSEFPGTNLDAHYDRLVAKPAAVAGQLLIHCGLQWDPSVWLSRPAAGR